MPDTPVYTFRFTAFSPQTLIAQACRFHNTKQREKAARLDDLFAEAEYISAQAHPRVLERVCVNYLHYLCERQYPEISEMRGNAERFEEYAQAKQAILKSISERFAWLEAECKRQALI
ncbi:hypothetical protein COW36_02750 [bacterium (Candidatus Blackallbacteria) CG17_big_fil_post_rev_8_21_14_2_50_48_46]|uniref:Uncharacterized protein n=1 Tax=bacterium (Candidatus Blackallbacteria) CG17_big_fil_post_rev_8_21_14_2_50_48_46 TaxID=2014261 RepID=A0A2M7GA76_9BACT|nr:MAG: hypothetical protein COW64_12725 [bacterium (Candidatus Blackallbacteria) CG18_big_fil_WC_8_21_14_2_50_49_26]PIW19048.1 MAG: hypothetical protein COW36_02750 [bacterium (Candidatus Blackallbacteria) CG17_big_fil_post_rev_8_21_14_2_50_48_46]PIW44585.1 MAG: hypothetical protein COW20_23370 [bacterium (Candidatus Blackallbacteria) CG13_big_fil_rev_8_21_14_2_50_49_14]